MRRVKVDVTIDPDVLKEIDALRGREKRSTFVEYLLRLGLESCRIENMDPQVIRRAEDKMKEA